MMDILGLATLVFVLGLKHGLDPDHLVAIDGFTRSSRSRWCGLFFSLGHGVVVTLVGVGVALVAADWQPPQWLEYTGAWISIGVLLALFGASGVFGQLQDALNTIWGVKVKPGGGIWGFLRSRFLSFAMVGGVCFLLLVSLTLESVLKGFSHYVQAVLPGGIVIALAVYWIFDLAVVILLFAIIFKFLPDAKIQWGDVWIGAAMTAIFFAIGKWALGLYLGSGSAASAYGAASSLITLLLWVYYSSQILLFGAEFTQVYACRAGRGVAPDEYATRI